MDQAHIQLLAERYRRMPDEALISLQLEQASLTEEAREALAAVIAERPHMEKPAVEMAEEAADDAESRKKRPLIGAWLGLLTFGLCVAPFRYAWNTWTEIWSLEGEMPMLREQQEWHVHKSLAGGLCMTMFIAAVIALHAIYARKTRAHLWRIIAALWFMSLGVIVLDIAVAAAAYGLEVAYAALTDREVLAGLGVSVLLASLWTAYLLGSKRCRMLFPKQTDASSAKASD